MITGSVRNAGRGIAETFATTGARIIINGRKAADGGCSTQLLPEDCDV